MDSLLSFLPRWSSAPSPANAIDQPHPKEAITRRNAEKSRLYQLPSELIFEIDSYLESSSTVAPNVPKMVFRATCRRFHSILPGPPQSRRNTLLIGEDENIKDVRWKDADRVAYTRLLRLTWFRELCNKERGGLLGKEKLVCCICRRTHDEHCFTESERKKGPGVRCCIGSQGVLEVCGHVKSTWTGLKLRRMEFKCIRAHGVGGLGEVRVRRMRTPGAVSERTQGEVMVEVALPILEVCQSGGVRVRSMSTPDAIGVRTQEEVVVEVELPVLEIGKETKCKPTTYRGHEKENGNEREGGIREKYQVGEEQEVSMKDKALEMIRKSNWKICPHMHTSSAQVEGWLERLLETSSIFSDLNKSMPYWRRRYRTESWPTHKCSTPHCDTRVTLLRKAVKTTQKSIKGTEEQSCEVEKEFLVLRIERYLGDMMAADDKRWMTQIVEASCLDEDRWAMSRGFGVAQREEMKSEEGK